MTDHDKQAERLAAALDDEVVRTVSLDVIHTQAAALLRSQSARIAELEAAQAGIMQAITDPENQPSQYGTVPMDFHEQKIKEWECKFERMFDLQQAKHAQLERVTKERDALRAELSRLREPLSDEQLNDLIPSPYVGDDYLGYSRSDICRIARAIERAHGIQGKEG